MAGVRDRIHTVRAQRPWTQAQLERAIEVDRSTVSALLDGCTGPPRRQAGRSLRRSRERLKTAVGRLQAATEEVRQIADLLLDVLDRAGDRDQPLRASRARAA
jgi:transcriptional regulator with XRE-family HTH domain